MAEPKEYKVMVITEGGLGAVLFGASKLPIDKLEQTLNDHGKNGWSLDFMVLEAHRYLLFWTREAVVITLSRPAR